MLKFTGERWLGVATIALASILMACQGVQSGGGGGNPPPPPPPPPPPADITSVKHIVIMMQENRSFDTYFGKLPDYWAANSFPSQQFDGIPANASNPTFDMTGTINAYHLKTMCFANVSPSWNESHVDFNRANPTAQVGTMDGYVSTAAHYAQNAPPAEAPINDTAGKRAMGYYDGNDLNYYYFMASNFATSDRWFSPVMARTQPNRLYLLAATSQGHAYSPSVPLDDPSNPNPPKTIFQALEEAGVTWKIYETDPGAAFLSVYFPNFSALHPDKFATVDQYKADAANGTLPEVALIESGYNSGRDEHPNNNIQTGAAYAADLINALMTSQSWKDSVFFLTFDEGGGVYDHVSPIATVSPDDVAPKDLQPTDICAANPADTCSFKYTGFRVPLLVISPFTKKNFVSHTPADYTALLKFIEKRYDLDALTARDAAQMDMTEFFDFPTAPWSTPPVPPVQATNGICNFEQLE